jgi:hypothetical protein
MAYMHAPTKCTNRIKYNHKIATATCSSTPVPSSGVALGHVTFKTPEKSVRFVYNNAAVIKCS